MECYLVMHNDSFYLYLLLKYPKSFPFALSAYVIATVGMISLNKLK